MFILPVIRRARGRPRLVVFGIAMFKLVGIGETSYGAYSGGKCIGYEAACARGHSWSLQRSKETGSITHLRCCLEALLTASFLFCVQGSYYYFDGEKLAQGREKVQAVLRETPELTAKLEQKVMGEGIGLCTRGDWLRQC